MYDLVNSPQSAKKIWGISGYMGMVRFKYKAPTVTVSISRPSLDTQTFETSYFVLTDFFVFAWVIQALVNVLYKTKNMN